eukprot:6957634-Pyramimonas_sp.AAC.1
MATKNELVREEPPPVEVIIFPGNHFVRQSLEILFGRYHGLLSPFDHEVLHPTPVPLAAAVLPRRLGARDVL